MYFKCFVYEVIYLLGSDSIWKMFYVCNVIKCSPVNNQDMFWSIKQLKIHKSPFVYQ